MNLFTRLLKLHTGSKPTEDFFTEVVAHLFTNSSELLFDWLEYNNLLDTSSYTQFTVSTQQSFEALIHHPMGTRPDIFIKLSSVDNDEDWIFIESKIGSSEGLDQLSRYAEIMAIQSTVRKKILVYVTRDYEPKEEGEILTGNAKTQVVFRQMRWYEFYKFLLNQPNNCLTNEVIKFMKENRMTQNNEFNAVDVLALANLPKVLSLMNETLADEISAKFKLILGSTPSQNKMLSALRWQRFELHVFQKNGLFCGLGYQFPNESVTDYPDVQLLIAISPNASIREQAKQSMHEIIKQRSDWQEVDSNKWIEFRRKRSLREFLSSNDHVFEIKKYFGDLLEELESIKSKYPNLFERTVLETADVEQISGIDIPVGS